jgi:hypothetical protein
MIRKSPKEEFCWVVGPDERPVALDEDERPVLRLIPGGDEVPSGIGSRSDGRERQERPPGTVTRSAWPRRDRVAIRHPRTALGSACVVAFAVGWTLAGTAAAEARAPDWETSGGAHLSERLVSSVDETNLVGTTEKSKGAST